MLQGKIIDTMSNTADAIVIDQSRCLRMRFNKSTCSECIKHCRFNAVRINEGVDIKRDACSECMLCVSVCPSGCFDTKAMDFYSLIARLKKAGNSVPSPVLGCNDRADLKAHERTLCFGFLSENHIIALSVFLERRLQINLTGCADCRNSFTAYALQDMIASIEAKTSIKISDRIKLIKDRSKLEFHDISYDRRGFFKAIKDLTFIQATGLFSNKNEIEQTQSYSAKKLPLKRELINRAIKMLPNENKIKILKSYYYDVSVTETCNNCFACVGMCPTGALKIEDKDDYRELFFSSSLCNGCGLCREFCITSSVNIEEGFQGHDPFEFNSAKKFSLCGV